MKQADSGFHGGDHYRVPVLFQTRIFPITSIRDHLLAICRSWSAFVVLDSLRYLTKYKDMRDVLSITKALADSNRLRILMALRGRELCVCQITELLQLAPSTVSQHLAVLHGAHLLESRKDERWIHYRWPHRTASAAVRDALDWASRSLGNEPQITTDSKHLKTILRQNPKLLCQRQTRR